MEASRENQAVLVLWDQTVYTFIKLYSIIAHNELSRIGKGKRRVDVPDRCGYTYHKQYDENVAAQHGSGIGEAVENENEDPTIVITISGIYPNVMVEKITQLRGKERSAYSSHTPESHW